MSKVTHKQRVIELKSVTKHYGRSRGIESVDLDVCEGEILGFLGPNGAGKSTTINILLDIIRPSQGTVEIFGQPVKNNAKLRREVGYLAGDMETDPSLTGGQYLAYAANLRGGVDRARINELVERLRCDVKHKIRHLSRGNKQKIGLVAALMHNPDLLILDEPTSGLDPLIQNEFNAIIKDHQKQGKTTFMSSHVLSEVQVICDRVGFIKGGRLLNVGNLDKLLADAARRVSIIFAHGAPDSQLKTMTGVSDYQADGHRRSFRFNGDYNRLLASLGSKSITDLQIAEPDLEEFFMNYYQSGDKNV